MVWEEGWSAQTSRCRHDECAGQCGAVTTRRAANNKQPGRPRNIRPGSPSHVEEKKRYASKTNTIGDELRDGWCGCDRSKGLTGLGFCLFCLLSVCLFVCCCHIVAHSSAVIRTSDRGTTPPATCTRQIEAECKLRTETHTGSGNETDEDLCRCLCRCRPRPCTPTPARTTTRTCRRRRLCRLISCMHTRIRMRTPCTCTCTTRAPWTTSEGRGAAAAGGARAARWSAIAMRADATSSAWSAIAPTSCRRSCRATTSASDTTATATGIANESASESATIRRCHCRATPTGAIASGSGSGSGIIHRSHTRRTRCPIRLIRIRTHCTDHRRRFRRRRPTATIRRWRTIGLDCTSATAIVNVIVSANRAGPARWSPLRWATRLRCRWRCRRRCPSPRRHCRCRRPPQRTTPCSLPRRAMATTATHRRRSRRRATTPTTTPADGRRGRDRGHARPPRAANGTVRHAPATGTASGTGSRRRATITVMTQREPQRRIRTAMPPCTWRSLLPFLLLP